MGNALPDRFIDNPKAYPSNPHYIIIIWRYQQPSISYKFLAKIRPSYVTEGYCGMNTSISSRPKYKITSSITLILQNTAEDSRLYFTSSTWTSPATKKCLKNTIRRQRRSIKLGGRGRSRYSSFLPFLLLQNLDGFLKFVSAANSFHGVEVDGSHEGGEATSNNQVLHPQLVHTQDLACARHSHNL